MSDMKRMCGRAKYPYCTPQRLVVTEYNIHFSHADYLLLHNTAPVLGADTNMLDVTGFVVVEHKRHYGH